MCPSDHVLQGLYPYSFTNGMGAVTFPSPIRQKPVVQRSLIPLEKVFLEAATPAPHLFVPVAAGQLYPFAEARRG